MPSDEIAGTVSIMASCVRRNDRWEAKDGIVHYRNDYDRWNIVEAILCD